MRPELIEILACPKCDAGLSISTRQEKTGEIESGQLNCQGCNQTYPIVHGIPRFVVGGDDYASNFGIQWEKFNRTQIDAFNRTKESEKRFRAETGWDENDLQRRLVLDAGCGAGRFTAIAASWGAMVVAVDLTARAIEACARNTKELGLQVDCIQASIYALPFRRGVFDKLFSLGVLQHTPDPAKAMRTLPIYLRPGGEIAYWIYERRWTRFLMARTYLRPITRRLPPRANYILSLFLTAIFFPITLVISLLPGGQTVVKCFPISARHYWRRLSIREQWHWTVLDTFDTYAPAYEFVQSEADVVSSLEAASVEGISRRPARGMAIVGRKAATGGALQ
ncbi:MAG: methyltransferase domain-containing protein [Euryarchaeota archaeon]|nr:methyltransferase domain-containing protein [Euryarchaeota archaeon]